MKQQYRELFNISGREVLLLVRDDTEKYSLRLDTLKAWILEDLKEDLNINLVNNTSDKTKPLSDAQKFYIDSEIKHLIGK